MRRPVAEVVGHDEGGGDDGRGGERGVVADQGLADGLGDQQQQDDVEDRHLRQPALAAHARDEQEQQVAPESAEDGFHDQG
jgi:hypothetical protein